MENHTHLGCGGVSRPIQNAQRFLELFAGKIGVTESIQGLPLLSTFKMYRLSPRRSLRLAQIYPLILKRCGVGGVGDHRSSEINLSTWRGREAKEMVWPRVYFSARIYTIEEQRNKLTASLLCP